MAVVPQACALWADSYPPHSRAALIEAERAVVMPVIAASASASPRRALDVGTGSERNLPFLASTGARLVCGVDDSMSTLAQQTSGQPRVCGDACRLPFRNGSFDLISSSLMMGDIEELAQCLAELARVLARGGHLVYSDFHPAWAAGKGRLALESGDGQSIALAYWPHSITAHVAHLERHGLDVLAVHEAHVAPSVDPVVAVFHAVRRS